MRTSYVAIDFEGNASPDDVSSGGEAVVPFGIDSPFVIGAELWMEEGIWSPLLRNFDVDESTTPEGAIDTIEVKDILLLDSDIPFQQ